VRKINVLSEKGKLGAEGAKKVRNDMLKMDSVLGLLEGPAGNGKKKDIKDLGKEVEKLIREREDARKAKDFAKSDRIRDKLKGMGVVLEDSPTGVRWKLR
jgi:cysteinyl-tRNA synthetase